MNPPNPHDAFVRKLLVVDRAADLFRAIMDPQIVEALDWSTLNSLPANFVDEKLRETSSDLLFELRAKSGKPHQIYVLFEHKSKPDRGIFMQMLGYLYRIYEQQAAGAKKGKKFRPVPVIPVVLYHNKRRWPYPTSFLDFMALPETDLYTRTQLNFGFTLLDLGTVDPGTLQISLTVRLGLYALRYSRDSRAGPEVWEKVAELTRDYWSDRDLVGVIRLAMNYLRAVKETPDAERILETFVKVGGARAQEEIMTAAEELIQKGMTQGIEKGEHLGLVKVARTMLEKGMSSREVLELTGLTEADLRAEGLLA